MEERSRHFPDAHDNPELLVVGDFLFDSTVNGAFASAVVVADLLAKQIAKR